MLKVWSAVYNLSLGYGASEYGETVVVANTESEALGLCLIAAPKTNARGWVLCPVDTSTAHCEDVCIYES
jgi:hypothetical protein